MVSRELLSIGNGRLYQSRKQCAYLQWLRWFKTAKDAENDIFNGLSDQDKVIKINELKDLYQDLYNRIITLYDKVNDIPKDDELIKVYNFVIDNLSDLKQFVYDYLTNTFDNKTYLENMVNYKKYLSTLNVINGILEEIRKGLYKESGN